MLKPLLFLPMLIIMACNQSQRSRNKPIKDTVVYLPYRAWLNNGFEKGSNSNLKRVLDVWKEFEKGDITKQVDAFTDTITISFHDAVLKGPAKEVLAAWKKRRDVYETTMWIPDTWMPVKSLDNSREYVFIWGRYIGQKTNKQNEYFDLHESWEINPKGKIVSMKQYLAHPG